MHLLQTSRQAMLRALVEEKAVEKERRGPIRGRLKSRIDGLHVFQS